MLPARVPQNMWYSESLKGAPDYLRRAWLEQARRDPILNLNSADNVLLLRLLQLDLVGSLVRDTVMNYTSNFPDLNVAERHVIEQVEKLMKGDPQIAEEGWQLVIQHWELFVGSSKTVGEEGHLIFTNHDRTKFVLIDFFPYLPIEHCFMKGDAEMILQRQTMRFLALAHYLPIPEVNWVRSTYTSLEFPTLQPQLFAPTGSIPPSTASTSPQILALTLNDIKPCLYSNELRKIDDGFLAHVNLEPQKTARSQIQLFEDSKDPFPLNYRVRVYGEHFAQAATQICVNCEVIKPATEFNICTGCWSVLYCNQACQRQHYSTHKRLCAKKEKKKE